MVARSKQIGNGRLPGDGSHGFAARGGRWRYQTTLTLAPNTHRSFFGDSTSSTPGEAKRGESRFLVPTCLKSFCSLVVGW